MSKSHGSSGMSLSTAIELNDIVGSLLEIATYALSSSSLLPSSVSSSSSHVRNAEEVVASSDVSDALDPRDICRNAIVHLQTSVRAEAEAEAERRFIDAMHRNLNTDTGMEVSMDMGTSAVDGDVASLPSATASSSSSSSLNIDMPCRNNNQEQNHHVSHADVLQAQQRLDTARQQHLATSGRSTRPRPWNGRPGTGSAITAITMAMLLHALVAFGFRLLHHRQRHQYQPQQQQHSAAPLLWISSPSSAPRPACTILPPSWPTLMKTKTATTTTTITMTTFGPDSRPSFSVQRPAHDDAPAAGGWRVDNDYDDNDNTNNIDVDALRRHMPR